MRYTVREVAEKLGIPSSTIRFYDKKGLLPLIERSPSGVRVFTDRDVMHLQELLILKSAGFSLKEMAEYVSLEIDGEEAALSRYNILERHCDMIESEIARLQDILKVLKEQGQRCIGEVSRPATDHDST